MNASVKHIIDEYPNSHVAQLLALPNPDLSLDSDAKDFDDLFGKKLANLSDIKSITKCLIEAKKIVATRYAHELITNPSDDIAKHDRLGKFWTSFADWSISRALSHAYHLPTIKRFFKTLPEPGQSVEGLFVLGLGKLGGYDLNYSSDVDLVSFFDADSFMVRPGEGKTDIAGRVLKTLTQILTGTGANRVWRVDWRLRPDPSSTGLSMAFDAGLDYFFFKSAPWRRLAMMKARPVAGDCTLGEKFLEELVPFIWRKTLDFRAVADIADLKSRIHEEHPELEGERSQDTPLQTLENFNVKLGSGGIREIEFTANALQLVWGGRESALRTTHTISALQHLGRLDLIPEADSVQMQENYCSLRGYENRIQLLADAHTHIFPTSGTDKELFLALNQEEDRISLHKKILKIREQVHLIFEDHFTKSDDTNDIAATEELTSKLDEAQLQIIQSWRDGFTNYGMNRDDTARLAPLFVWLLNHLENSANPVDDITAIDRFFSSLPPGGQYLFLLAEFPKLAGDVLPPLTGSGAMANLLRHSPHVVDTLIQRKGQTETSHKERQKLVEPIFEIGDYGSQLEAIRSFVNEMLYLTFLGVWRGQLKPDRARRRLTNIAKEALSTCMRLASLPDKKEFSGLSIVGFGKLGMAEMMPESDLDLVFLAHGENELEIEDVAAAHRFSDRLKTALTAQMRGGKVYETDTRLRPSGQSGAPTVRLSTFREHQINRAKTWEHLALVPACFAHGSALAERAFIEVRTEVLLKPREQNQLAEGAHAMLAMLREHRIKKPASGTLALKLMPGGLMEAEYLVSFLVLKFTADNPELAKLPYCELPKALEEIMPEIRGFSDALLFLQDTHFCERLYGWTENKINSLNLIGTPLEPSKDVLESLIQQHTLLVGKLIDDHLVKPSGLSKKAATDYEQKNVAWE